MASSMASTIRLGEYNWVRASHSDFLRVLAFVVAGLAYAAPQTGRTEKGLELARGGDLKAAETELRAAVALAPNDPDALATLGSVLGMEHRLEEADTYLERALRIEPANLVVRRNLAAGQWQLGRLREAATNLVRVLKAKPGDPPTVLLLGMVKENQKDYARAAELLASVPELARQRTESIAALARSYYRTGRKGKAKDTLEYALKPPLDAQAVLLCGDIASLEGDSETALKLFDSIRGAYPDKNALTYSMALAQFRGGHFREAEDQLLTLSGSAPTSGSYSLLAWCYFRQRKFQEAVRAMDLAIDLDPRKESNYLDLGRMLTDHDLLVVARAVTLKAVQELPDSFRAYMLKGLVEAKQGDLAAAVVSYRRAVALNPDAPEPNYNLAKMQSLAGMDKEAQETFERGMRKFPKDARTCQEYALVQMRRAENGIESAEASAVSLFQRAISLDNALWEPHYQLGNLWLAKGRTVEAVKELETALTLNRKEAEIHFALSRAYRRSGGQERASVELAAYEELKAHPEKPD